jgi:uncharacterized membrane-anchored protein
MHETVYLLRGLRIQMIVECVVTHISSFSLSRKRHENPTRPTFDELEKLKDDKTGCTSNASGPQIQFGDEAYHIQLGAAKPGYGMPCRLSLRV